MTRRIALAILLTVWILLIAGGLLAYVTTRSILIADLDESLVARAEALVSATPSHDESPLPVSLDDGGRYLVTNDRGQTIARPNALNHGDDVERLAAAFTKTAGRPERTITIRVPIHMANGSSQSRTITYSAPTDSLDRLLSRLALTLLAFGAIAGLLAAAVAWIVSRIALRPLDATAAQIASIDDQSLSSRIDSTRLPPELRPMADRLNELLQRLEDAFARQRRFIADASHELRTPVASLMTALEICLRQTRPADQYRQTIHGCFIETKHLRLLVERLMDQVRSDRPQSDEPFDSLDAAGLLAACCDTIAPLAAEKNVSVTRDFNVPSLCTTQPSRFKSIFLNLLSNAVEYNKPGGSVIVACHSNPDSHDLEISIRDTGTGIAPEHLPKLFDPFFRADGAHASSGHLGLGLSLVRAHARALGGDCTVESSSAGTIFWVFLPSALESAATKSKTSPHPSKRVVSNAPRRPTLSKNALEMVTK